MFDTIAGLPLHPLIIHVVVIVLPVAALGAIAMAVLPSWPRRFDWLVVGAVAVAAVAAVVATQSGIALASRVGTPVDHMNVARWVQWAALLLLVAVACLWWLDRRAGSRASSRAPSRRESRTGGARVAAGVCLVLSVVALGLVGAAGHSGATAVWGSVVANTQPGDVPVG